MINYTLQNELYFLNDFKYLGDNRLEVNSDSNDFPHRPWVFSGIMFLSHNYEPIRVVFSGDVIVLPVIRTIVEGGKASTELGIFKFNKNDLEYKNLVDYLQNQKKSYPTFLLDAIFQQLLEMKIVGAVLVTEHLVIEDIHLQIIKQEKYRFKSGNGCDSMKDDDEFYCVNKFAVCNKQDGFRKEVTLHSNWLLTDMIFKMANFSKKYHIRYFNFDNYREARYRECHSWFGLREVVDIHHPKYEVCTYVPYEEGRRVFVVQTTSNFRQIQSLLSRFEFTFHKKCYRGREEGTIETRVVVKYPNYFIVFDRYLNRLFDMIFASLRSNGFDFEPTTTIFNHKIIEEKTYWFSSDSIDNNDITQELSPNFKSTELAGIMREHIFFYFSRVYNRNEHFFWMYFDENCIDNKI